ncbi:hypothetical protein BDW74DRAFT_173878 [Aspergillus multicolor]|uniref:S-adenosylmethionine-dependent methyltransferase n=1 Tax=Aspergillus multicolor TaxID=41759 RepID=UPI003CCDFA00
MSDNKTTPGPAPNGLGRGLFATRDLRACENVLHIENPFIAILETDRLDSTCSGCFGIGKNQRDANENGRILKACTGCHVVKYCDKACQAKDWKLAHSHECAIFRKLKPRVLPINARALLRMVLRTNAKKNAFSKEELDLFRSLETHIVDIRRANSEQWQRIALTAKAVKEYSGTELEEELIAAFCAKLDLNSFNLTDSRYDRIGVYVHPYAALINHSCDYNAVVGFDGPELYIRALRPIAKGEQIFICYIDTTYPAIIRQKELRERFYFECRCDKCLREQTLDTKDGSQAAALAMTNKFFENLPDMNKRQQLVSTIEALLENDWPVRQQPFPYLLGELIAADLSAGKTGNAFVCDVFRYVLDKDVYPQGAHPCRALHLWSVALTAMHLYDQSMTDALLETPTIAKKDWDKSFTSSIKVNYGLIAFTLLSTLVQQEETYCTVPGFRLIIREAFAQMQSEFIKPGVNVNTVIGRMDDTMTFMHVISMSVISSS